MPQIANIELAHAAILLVDAFGLVLH